MRTVLLSFVAALVLSKGGAAQSTLSVPSAAFPGIQSAIDAATDGDVILIAPGTFVENIDFLGKAVSLIGSGPYATIIDGSGADAPTIVMHNYEGSGTVLMNVGVTGGSGFLPANAPQGAQKSGGGLDIFDFALLGAPVTPIDPPLIKNCRFYGNQCFGGTGAAVHGYQSDAVFEDCVFEQNVGVSPMGSRGWGAGFFFGGRYCRLERCIIRDNETGQGGGIGAQGDHLELIDCLVLDNEATEPITQAGYGGGFQGLLSTGHFVRTVFAGNLADGQSGGVQVQVSHFGGTGLTMESCTVVDNQAAFYSGIFAGAGPIQLRNCTIANNVDTNLVSITGPVTLFQIPAYNDPVTVSNTIIHGNTGGNLWFSGNAITVHHSNIQGGWPGMGNVDVLPGFVDAANGDYRLAYGSPMVDAGDAAAAAAIPFDFEGEPRSIYFGVDIGADECDDIAYHVSSSGTLIEPGVGFHTALTIDGDDGGPDRRVEIPLGAPWSLAFDSPDWMTPAPQFAIFGVLGEPAFETVTPLPFGWGTMSLPPCPLLPAWEGILFTLTSTVAGMPCVTVAPAQPGDLTLGPIPGCPVPLDVGFQALLLDAIGQPYVSNLVIAKIR